MCRCARRPPAVDEAPSGLRIRRATAADADDLTSISRHTFAQTFGHQYAKADLDRHLAQTYSADEYALALDEHGCAAWLLEDGAGQVLGYAFAGPCALPHAQVQPGDLELKRLYLDAAVQNQGWGSRLFDAAMGWMHANHPDAIWIGVFSQNEGAQRFYARHGFDKVGDYLYPVGETRDLEFILRRSVAPQ